MFSCFDFDLTGNIGKNMDALSRNHMKKPAVETIYSGLPMCGDGGITPLRSVYFVLEPPIPR